MNIMDHGAWTPYTPAVPAEPVEVEGEAPAPIPVALIGAIFCRRESDGTDWYTYSRAESSFQPESVKITCLSTDLGLITQAVATDPAFLFPQNCTLIEVQGWEGSKPEEVFGLKLYDPLAGTFSPIPQPVQPVITFKKDIWVRATDAEADTIEQVLGQQSTRKQNIFREASYLDHADPLFAELQAGFAQAFGAERAGQLLAGS